MNKSRLITCSVSELNAHEQKETSGGLIGRIIAAYILTEAILNPQAHIDAFWEGYNM